MRKIVKKIIPCLALIFVMFGVYWFVIHPNTYKLNTAVNNGDVVMGPEGLVNLEKFHVFVKNIENKHPDQIRITTYSKEGYPTIYDLYYDGKVIKCTIDNTRNLYGREYFKRYSEYTKIAKNITNDYILEDNTGKYKTQWILQE
jgi:hypothetical protein